jgi:hypothetical protein
VAGLASCPAGVNIQIHGWHPNFPTKVYLTGGGVKNLCKIAQNRLKYPKYWVLSTVSYDFLRFPDDCPIHSDGRPCHLIAGQLPMTFRPKSSIVVPPVAAAIGVADAGGGFLLDLLMLGPDAWENLVAVTLGLAFAVALVRMVREGLGSGERGVASQMERRDS